MRALVTCTRCNIIFTYVTKNNTTVVAIRFFEILTCISIQYFCQQPNIQRVHICALGGPSFFLFYLFKAQKNVREYFLLPVSCFSLVFLLLAFFLRPFFSRSSKVNWIEKSGCMEAVHVITEKKSTTALVMSDFLLHQKTGRTPRLGQVYVQFRSIKLKSHFKGGNTHCDERRDSFLVKKCTFAFFLSKELTRGALKCIF